MIVYWLITALLLTIIIESAVLYVAGCRDRQVFKVWVAVNVLTNPVLNLLVRLDSGLLWPLEIAVIFVEAGIVRFALKQKYLKWFKYSLLLNAVSFALGLVLSHNINYY